MDRGSKWPFSEEVKDVGIAVLVLAIIFSLSVGVALIFHYI
jgi:preprotein translocase subunit SecE